MAFTGLLALVGLTGYASFEGLQSSLIFRPTDTKLTIDTPALTEMQERWIDFTSEASGKPVRLHGLWQEATSGATDAPIILFLHGARWDVTSSSYRFRRLRDLGFAVLGIDYRGFGKSSPDRPTETLAYEDARAAWAWLARHHPQRARYVYGHSLGGAIASSSCTATPPSTRRPWPSCSGCHGRSAKWKTAGRVVLPWGRIHPRKLS